MSISVGDTLPDVTLHRVDAEGRPEEVTLSSLTKGRKVIIFGLPGAYTGTCTSAHVPSFIRTKGDFDAKGVDDIICVSVNDAFVMGAWGDSTGANEAGILMLGDPAAEFTKAVGLNFTAPPVGFYDRCQRCAMYAEDGVVKVMHLDENPGVCDVSGGEAMLEAI